MSSNYDSNDCDACSLHSIVTKDGTHKISCEACPPSLSYRSPFSNVCCKSLDFINDGLIENGHCLQCVNNDINVDNTC